MSTRLRAKTALEDALLQPVPPTLIDVARNLGYARQTALREYCPELCEKVLARRKEHRTQQLNQIRETLQSMLLDSTAPTMNEAAKRLGYKSFNYSKPVLLRYFPELCAALKDRFEAHRKLKRQRLLRLMEDAINENPPPSLKEVVSRTKYLSGSFSAIFPVQREAIKARYREFQKKLAAERKAIAKSRIKQLALQLYAKGVYPTGAEIMKACNGKVGMTTAESQPFCVKLGSAEIKLFRFD